MTLVDSQATEIAYPVVTKKSTTTFSRLSSSTTTTSTAIRYHFFSNSVIIICLVTGSVLVFLSLLFNNKSNNKDLFLSSSVKTVQKKTVGVVGNTISFVSGGSEESNGENEINGENSNSKSKGNAVDQLIQLGYDEHYSVKNPHTGTQCTSTRYSSIDDGELYDDTSIQKTNDYTNRSKRFPSIEQRLQVYLSSWYVPPCSEKDPSIIRYRPQHQYAASATPTLITEPSAYNVSLTKLTGRRSKLKSNHNETIGIKIPTQMKANTFGDNSSTVTIDVWSCCEEPILKTTANNSINVDNNNFVWPIRPYPAPDILFYVDDMILRNLIYNITIHNTKKSDIKDIDERLVYTYTVDIAQTLIKSLNRIGWWSSSGIKNISTTLTHTAVTTNKTRRSLSRSRRKNSKNSKRSGQDKSDNSVNQPPPPPVIVQYGDWDKCKLHPDREVTIPRIKKFRHSIDPNVLFHTFRNIGSAKDAIRKNEGENTKKRRCSSTRLSIPTIGEQSISPTRISPTRNTVVYPILWKLNTKRHYGFIADIDTIDTVPYNKKKNKAVFRGSMTGHIHWDDTSNKTSEQNCRAIQRCNLVLLYYTSSIIDAKITAPYKPRHPEYIDIMDVSPSNIRRSSSHSDTSDKVKNHNKKIKQRDYRRSSSNYKSHTKNNDRKQFETPPFNRVYIRGEKLSLEEMLQYKILIMVEGNDVSSGLKWALYSNCVVVMPYPVLSTSWAMEELLEPYVHFVPVYHNLSNVEDQVQWILNNEREAMYISLRGRLWIEDLISYPNEDEFIQDEILKRYHANFLYQQ